MTASREAQGPPPTVTDPDVLREIARIITASPTPNELQERRRRIQKDDDQACRTDGAQHT